MSAQPIPISHWRRAWLYVLVAAVLLFLIVPMLIVVPMSFSGSEYLEFPPREWSLRWYASYFNSPEWMASTRVSFAAAYALNAVRLRLTPVLQVILLLPQMVPVILIGIGVFYIYIQLQLVNTLFGIVLAHTLLAVPFVVVTVMSGLRSYDMTQEKVARSLGAPRWKAFMLVTLPQIKLSVISGALFAFITSLDEVVIGLFIAGGDNTVLTRRMFQSLRDQIDPTIAAISSLLIILSAVVLASVAVMGGGKKQRSASP
mgnify:CR=1 FL=1